MKTILVTGGLGYIGSHAVVAFENAGYKTVIIDNLSNSSLSCLDGIAKILGYKPDFFEVDLRNTEELEKIFSIYAFNGVLHFAGLKSVSESCEQSFQYFDNNIVGSLRLFECMQDYNVKNIIFSSSAAVYEAINFATGQGVCEIGVTGHTSNPYGTAKFILEQILRDLSRFSGFRVMNLRYFNPIGAHNSGIIGEKPFGVPNNLLPSILKVAASELEILSIFGDDFETTDGTGVRDYIDIEDLIEGHLKAYEHIVGDQGFFKTYNLGTGKGVSVMEMIHMSEKVTGKMIQYKIVGRRSGDLGNVFCNADKAKNELDWEAKVGTEESIKNAWKFYNSGRGIK